MEPHDQAFDLGLHAGDASKRFDLRAEVGEHRDGDVIGGVRPAVNDALQDDWELERFAFQLLADGRNEGDVPEVMVKQDARACPQARS